jgi:signal transduction histidine kinase
MPKAFMKRNTAACFRLKTTLRYLATYMALLITMLVACAQPCAASDPNPPSVRHLTQAEVLVDDTSSLHSNPNDVINESELHGSWKPATLPLVLKRTKGTDAVPRTVWVRVRLDDFSDWRGPLDLFLVRWIAPGELSIYLDGHLNYRSSGTPMWNLRHRPSVHIPLVLGESASPPHTVLIRLDWLAGQVVGISSIYVGTPSSIESKANYDDLVGNQIPFMVSIGLLAISLVGFGIWCIHKNYPGHLILVNSMLGIVWRWHFYLGDEVPKVPDTWYVWLTTNAALWQVILSHYILQALHGRQQRWVNRGLLILSVFFAIARLPWQHPSLASIAQWHTVSYLFITALYLAVAVIGIRQAWRSRSLDACILAGVMLVGWLAAVLDIMKALRLTDMESLYYTTYIMRLFTVTYIYLMFRHYWRLGRKIRSANTELAQRLRDKEDELMRNNQRLREIEHQQILGKERQRLMQDMHDGLGSSLASALRIAGSRRDTIELETAIRRCIDDLKLTVDSMEPVDGDLLLLLATLRYRFGPRLQCAGIVLHWEVADVPKLDWLNPHTAMHILRILQEALANVLQHTQATEIWIATQADAHAVQVSVSDNGHGFDVAAAILKGGRGITNQRRRAAEIGGKVEWHSSTSGTTLLLSLPRLTG